MTSRAFYGTSLPLRAGIRGKIIALWASLHGMAPVIYLAISLPTVVFLTSSTPPFQAPDETNHFRRAVQLLRGQIVGRKETPVESGGVLPKSVDEVAEAFSYLIGNSNAKVSPELTSNIRGVRWSWQERSYTSFVNTVIYPPVFYLPGVAALAIGRDFGWPVLASYELARLATGVSAVLIATLAIHLAAAGRALMLAFLSLPTTLYLFASFTQDALLIACTALAFGLCSRAAGNARVLNGAERVATTLLLGAAIAARPPYAILAVVLLTSIGRCPDPRASRLSAALTRMLPFCGAVVIGLGWVIFGAGPAKVPFRVADGVSIAGQLRYLAGHPEKAFSIASSTVSGTILPHFEQFIGVLGWTDTLLPAFYYPLACIALALATVLALSHGDTALAGTIVSNYVSPSVAVANRSEAVMPVGTHVSLSRWQVALLVIACAVTWAAVYGTLYLTWTKVGADSVDGVQGRYFLPSAMLLVLAVPALSRGPAPFQPRPGAKAADVLRTCAWTVLLAAVVLSDLWLPRLVMLRFYG